MWRSTSASRSSLERRDDRGAILVPVVVGWNCDFYTIVSDLFIKLKRGDEGQGHVDRSHCCDNNWCIVMKDSVC